MQAYFLFILVFAFDPMCILYCYLDLNNTSYDDVSLKIYLISEK